MATLPDDLGGKAASDGGRRAVRLQDVADLADVSLSTVSRVVRDNGSVSPRARLAVQRAIDELGYRPDAAARSIRTGRSHLIGFVVSDISNPLFGAMAKGVDSELNRNGYVMMLGNSGNDAGREEEVIQNLLGQRVDGLVLAVADEQSRHLRGLLEQVPSVLVDRELPSLELDRVLSDHAGGLDRALDRLITSGHRRMALIAGHNTQYGSRARREAWQARARALGAEDWIDVEEDLSRESGAAAVFRLMKSSRPPTAIIAGSNQILNGVLEALSELGLEVPGDVSLVACDDTEICRFHSPQIAVVQRNTTEIARQAAGLILSRLEQPDLKPRRLLLETTFIDRPSIASPSVELETNKRSNL